MTALGEFDEWYGSNMSMGTQTLSYMRYDNKTNATETVNYNTTSFNSTMGFVFDTATSIMAVATSNCTNCFPSPASYDYYNATNSLTASTANYNISSLNNTSAEPLQAW